MAKKEYYPDATKISSETVNRNRDEWYVTAVGGNAADNAIRWGHKVYVLPNGYFAVRYPKKRSRK